MEQRFIANKNYILRKIAGKYVLVSVGEASADFRGVVTLNDSAKILWSTLQEGAAKEDLVAALKEAFFVTEEQAKEDVERSLEILLERGMILND